MTSYQTSNRVNSYSLASPQYPWSWLNKLQRWFANYPPAPATALLMPPWQCESLLRDQWPGPGGNWVTASLTEARPGPGQSQLVKNSQAWSIVPQVWSLNVEFSIYPNHKLASKASRRPGRQVSHSIKHWEVVNESRIQGNKDIDNIWRFFNSTDFITYVRIWQVLLEPLETC